MESKKTVMLEIETHLSKAEVANAVMAMLGSRSPDSIAVKALCIVDDKGAKFVALGIKAK